MSARDIKERMRSTAAHRVIAPTESRAGEGVPGTIPGPDAAPVQRTTTTTSSTTDTTPSMTTEGSPKTVRFTMDLKGPLYARLTQVSVDMNADATVIVRALLAKLDTDAALYDDIKRAVYGQRRVRYK